MLNLLPLTYTAIGWYLNRASIERHSMLSCDDEVLGEMSLCAVFVFSLSLFYILLFIDRFLHRKT